MSRIQRRVLQRRHLWLAACLTACQVLPLAAQAQDKSVPAPAAHAASATSVPALQPSKERVPKLVPPACKPEDFDPRCLQQADQAYASLVEVARQCPECASRIPPIRSSGTGRKMRPHEFCAAVETVGRLQGMSVSCTAK